MLNDPLPFILLGTIILISVALILIGLRFHKNCRISKVWMLVALSPSLLVSVLFWSLAIHMRNALGGWPSGIGYSEVEGPLRLHAELAFEFFEKLAGHGILLWMGYCILAAIVPCLRKSLFYAGVYSAGVMIVTLLMFTAPTGFQRWWWD